MMNKATALTLLLLGSTAHASFLRHGRKLGGNDNTVWTCEGAGLEWFNDLAADMGLSATGFTGQDLYNACINTAADRTEDSRCRNYTEANNEFPGATQLCGLDPPLNCPNPDDVCIVSYFEWKCDNPARLPAAPYLCADNGGIERRRELKNNDPVPCADLHDRFEGICENIGLTPANTWADIMVQACQDQAAQDRTVDCVYKEKAEQDFPAPMDSKDCTTTEECGGDPFGCVVSGLKWECLDVQNVYTSAPYLCANNTNTGING